MQVNSNSRQSSSDAIPPQIGGVTPAAKERAQRHHQRALEQIKMKNTNQAVQELRDAIAHDPENSEYHALLGKIHLEKGLSGMANINLRQALKLNPEQPIALECMQKLQAQANSQNKQPADLGSRILSFLNRKL